jgi:putative ABC transport system permease protein
MIARIIFALRYAVRSLFRDGTRTLLAILSVGFGVLSLVAMQSMASALLGGALFDQRLQVGGDGQFVTNDVGGVLSAEMLAQIDRWQEEGVLQAVTHGARGAPSMLRTPENGRVSFVLNLMGIDTATYPLVGTFGMVAPIGGDVTSLLREPSSVLITRDLAETRALAIGDTILVGGEGAPVRLTVTGILNATPSQQGSALYYSLETARLFAERDAVVTEVSFTWGAREDAREIVVASGLTARIALDRVAQLEESGIARLFDAMFKGAGVLGLLIGGVSVSNTLQVILARRKLEIAMLKTLGMKRSSLLLLMSIETGLVGLIGGLIGAALGSLVAGRLLETLISNAADALIVNWSPEPLIVGGGVLIGMITAVVFGMQTIIASSSTRPVELLRDQPVQGSAPVRLAQIGIYAVLFVVFGLLIGAILGSAVQGILYVVGGGIAVMLLRAIFWGLLWLLLKLPTPNLPMIRLARANLNQRKMQTSLAIIALFAGAFAVTFAALIVDNAQRELGARRGSDEGYNITIYTSREDAEAVLQAMLAQGAEDAITEEGGTRVQGMFAVEALDAATTALGQALPDALVVSLADKNAVAVAGFSALSTFATSIAGLAFVAGAVLIANVAGLAVVERRREIGVFKAVGYTSGHVLRLLLAEFGLLGLIAGACGLIGAGLAVVGINATQSSANLLINPTILGVMLAVCVGISLVSAAVVTWQPAHVRPLEVLRYE